MTPPMTFPPSRLQGKEYVEVDGGSWKHDDHVNLGEARATLRILEVATFNPAWHRMRHPVLSDSRVVVGAFAKGRSPSKKLNRIVKKWGSIQLATGVQVLLSWVWTRIHPADNLSRDRKRREYLSSLH